MYILGFIRPEVPSNLYLFHAQSDYEAPTYTRLMENVKSNKFVFPQMLDGIERGTYEYFIHDGNLYSIESSSNNVTLINSGNWTHIAGSTGHDLGGDTKTIAFGIKSGQLFKISENAIEEIGSNMTSNAFVNVTGCTTLANESTYGEHAYALTDKNEIFSITKKLEFSKISTFTEANTINYFGGMQYYDAIPHIIVDNKLYLIDKDNTIKLHDANKKWIKVFGAYAGYMGGPCYQYGLTEDGKCYKLYAYPGSEPYAIPAENTIVEGHQEDNNKWEYVAGVRASGYGFNTAIANKHLYLFIAGLNPDDTYNEQFTDSQKAYLIDDTKQWDWISHHIDDRGLIYVGLAENKLYHIKITGDLNTDTMVLYYTPTITEFPMPDGHTKCISCNQYGLYDNLIVPIFQ